MRTRGIAGNKGARRAGAVWGVLFLAAAACGPAFSATLEWGTYLGGSGNDYARSVALDGDGNVYVVGDTASAGWVSGGRDETFNDGVSTETDAFLVKLSPAGAHVWSTYLGGRKEEFGHGVALDGSGNVLVVGKTKSFGWVYGGWNTLLNGLTYDTAYTDGFLVKLSSAGSHVWSTYLGGNYNDGAKAVAVDADGNVLVAGETNSDAWVSGGWDVLRGATDGYAVKLSPGGAHLWSTYLGGAGLDTANGIAADTDGNVLVAGTTAGGWVSGGWDTVGEGQEGFLAKLSALGAHEWSTYLGGANSDAAMGVAVDGGGNVVVCGDTWSPAWVSGGAFTAYFGSRDGFVARFSPSGGHVWSSYFGGDKADYFEALALDAGGDAYVTGTTSSPGWVSGGWDTVVNGGGTTVSDGVVLRLSAAGTPVWSSYVGGLSNEYGHGVAVAADGTVVVAGETQTSGWIAGGYDTVYDGGYDGFAVKAVQTAERGALRMTLTPPEAVTAGAQWRLAGTTAWCDSGAEISGIPAGEVWVEFKQAGDWAAPLPVTVTVAAGTTTETSAVYAPAGALRVTITPADAVTAGARWRRVGTVDWRESGTTEGYVPAGDMQVEFNTVAGWISPPAQTVTVVVGATAELAAAYTDNRGALRVTITPAEAVAAGAQWRRVGTTTWRDSGAVESSVVPGDYQVECKAVSGWIAPSAQTVTVAGGETAEIAASYTDNRGALRVTITPAEAVAAGAQWRRVGTTSWLDSGAAEAGIPAGSYQVEFKALLYWTSPPVQTISVTAGTTAEASGEYAPVGALRVTITPAEAVAAGAQWRRVGTTTWRDSGTSEEGILAGDMQVEFNTVAGWISPPAQPVTVTAGATAELAAAYTDNRGAIRVTITPAEAVAAGAQWRREGTTTWYNSGVEVMMPAGDWQVEFKAVSGWITPPAQPVTVAVGETAEMAALYTDNRGALLVTITPAEAVAAGAQWRRVGTTPWFDGGAEVMTPAGAWQVEFKPLADWVAPAVRAVTVAVGTTTEVSGEYAPLLEFSAIPRAETWVTDGQVNAIAVTSTTIYLGGAFTYVGPNTGSLAMLDAVTGRNAPLCPKANSYVDACVSDGAGGWYIGGLFGKVGAVPRPYIAHILPDGSLDPAWNPRASGRVFALAVSENTVYAGGEFTSIGGQKRNRIAALDATTGVATAWNPDADFSVRALAVSGNTVYAGGDFYTIGGKRRGRIAALDAATGTATDWNPNASGSGAYAPKVRALAVSGATVYVAGVFSGIGGQSRLCIAALDAATGAATSWAPDADSTVSALVVSGGTVYAGGAFTTIGGQARNHLAALDAASGLATVWNPGADGAVSALAVAEETVYAGGDFLTIGGQVRNRIAALDAATGTPTAWNPGAGGAVNALAVSGSTVCAGGAFQSVGGQTRNRIAALDAATGVAIAWNPNANGNVSTLAVSGSTVYAGGDFTAIGGQARTRIAALDAATGVSTAWNPNANGNVSTLAVSGSTVYAGGDFTAIGGQARTRIAALDAATGTATAFKPSASGPVLALAVSGTTVYAGGTFTTIGGQMRNNIAALSTATGSATSWNPNADSTVYTLAVSGATVYVGGYFMSIGGQTRKAIAELSAATGSATSWNPNAIIFSFPEIKRASVHTLAVSGTTVYAGGKFNMIGGSLRFGGLAALDATVDTNNVTPWDTDQSGVVYALVMQETAVCAGGSFMRPRNNFAQYGASAGRVAPSNPGATIIGPYNITWTWQDNSAEETGYNVYSDPGAGPPVTLRATTAANEAAWTCTGLTPNTLHAFQVAATSAVGDSAKTANFFAWTLAAVAAAPVVTNPTPSSLDVTLNADSNPEGTLYAIQVSPEAGGGTWVQEDGSLGTTPVYQPAAVWGTVTVTGLAPQTAYSFTVTARNWDGVNAEAGPAALGTTQPSPLPPGPVVINGGAGTTNTTAVTLTVTWSPWAGFEVRRMRFSNDGATWSPWEPLAATRAWTLPGGDGYKTVRVQFLDRAGNYSERFSDYIRLDTTPPTGTIVINNNRSATLSPEVTLSLTWDDAGGSGVRRMRFSDNGSTWTPWEPLSATRAHTLPATPGYHTVRVTYRDAAGNVSERFADYIRLDIP